MKLKHKLVLHNGHYQRAEMVLIVTPKSSSIFKRSARINVESRVVWRQREIRGVRFSSRIPVDSKITARTIFLRRSPDD